MTGVELGLAVFGTLDVCLKYGRILIEKYKSLKEAENEIEERLVLIESSWTKTSQQLRFLRRVWGSLDDNYRDLQERILCILDRKLKDAVRQLSKLEKHACSSDGRTQNRRASKYALTVKKSLDNAIQDLQTWQREFDATWYLVLRVADRSIIEGLGKSSETNTLSVARHVQNALQDEPQPKLSVFLPENKLSSAQRSIIPWSSFQIIEVPGLNTFILDSVECDPRTDASIFSRNIRKLAQKLQKVDPFLFNLLGCLGVVRIKNPVTQTPLSFDFVFHIPKDCQRPQSLRYHLSKKDYSLSCRVNLAKQLATSVSYLHVLDFVHKGIRPETVLIFQSKEPYLLHLFLLGFKTFRTADGKTMRLGHTDQTENIYQHPERQGINPAADYAMQHDIYSLGVCLLEIGMWESFITCEADTNLPPVNLNFFSPTLARYSDLKDHFTTMAKEILPIKMGNKYAQVVVNCLTCMEDTNEDFGDQSQFEDEDGILIGVKYIEKILLQLSEISV